MLIPFVHMAYTSHMKTCNPKYFGPLAGSHSMDAYRGTAGTRPYAGAALYYAEYRQRVSTEFMLLLAARLGWTRAERVLDLGAGPGQLALLAAPLVAEVV